MTIRELRSTDFTVIGGKPRINMSRKSGPGLLLIRWNDCGHCQVFAPKYDLIDRAVGDGLAVMSIERAEINKNPALANALDFRGFPTLKFVDVDGNVTKEYTGRMDIEPILNELCKFYHVCAKNTRR